MSEKLTVAELLARSGRTAGSSNRPRRRRSLEDGGVSVAELTGSIPVVKEEHTAGAEKSEAAAGTDIIDRTKVAERPEEKTSQMRPVSEPASVLPLADRSPQQAEAPAEVATEAPAEVADDAGIVDAADDAEQAEQVEQAEEAETPGLAEPDAATEAPSEPEHGVDGSEASDAADTDADEAEDEFEDEPLVGIDHSDADLQALEENLADDEVIEYEDDTISWPALIGQAIASIAVGIGVFLGFSLLWSKLPTIFVLVLALAVTLLAVGVVHALLRHRDKLILLLTFVVGIVLTVGPRLIMGI